MAVNSNYSVQVEDWMRGYRNRIKILSFALICLASTQAFSQDADLLAGRDFYVPQDSSACNYEGTVYRLDESGMWLRSTGIETSVLKDINYEKTEHGFAIIGTPVLFMNGLASKPKKVSIEYKHVGASLVPMGGKLDDRPIDLTHGFPEAFTLRSCGEPTLWGMLLIRIGWQKAYDSSVPVRRVVVSNDGRVTPEN